MNHKKRRLSTNKVNEIEVNDDEGEKLKTRIDKNKRISLVAQSRPAFLTPKKGHRNSAPFLSPLMAKENSREILSDAQLSSLYTETIRLAAAGKITQKNTWSINLIDYIDDLLSHEKKEADEKVTKSSSLFRKASNTLDASIKIYSSRVDSVHSQMFKVLGGLSSNGLEDEESRKPAEGEDAAKARGDKKNSSAGRKGETLLWGEKAGAVCLRESDFQYEIDPMFFKMSTKFDEGGAKGLLLSNLDVGEDFQVVFDSDLPLKTEPGWNRAAAEKDGAEEALSAAGFRAIADEIGRTMGEESLCPLLGAFKREIARFRGEISQLCERAGQSKRGSALRERVERIAESENENADYDDAGSEAGTQEGESRLGERGPAEERALSSGSDLEDVGSSFDDGRGAEEWAADRDVAGQETAEAERGQRRNDISFTNELPEEDGDKILDENFLNWAGPNFWVANRNKRKALDKAAEGKMAGDRISSSAPAAKKRCAAEETGLIDFAQLFEAESGASDSQDAGPEHGPAKTAKRRQNRRKKAASNTLPVDMHLKADLFLRPFYRPHLLAKVDYKAVGDNESGGLEAAADEALNVRWYNYDNPNDRRYCAEIQGAPGNNDDLQDDSEGVDGDAFDSELSPLPASGAFGEKQVVGDFLPGGEAGRSDLPNLFAFNRITAEVDVRRLKNELWKSLEEIRAVKSVPIKTEEAADGRDAAATERATPIAVAEQTTEARHAGGVGEAEEKAENIEAGEKKEERADDRGEMEDPVRRDDSPSKEGQAVEMRSKVSFKESIENLKKRSRSLKAVSIQYCFVCLLHLANENELDLAQAEAMGDFGISMN